MLPRNAPAWLDRLSTWLDPFESCFGHAAQRGAFRRYLLGLLSDSRRKSMSAMLARVGDPGTYQAFQHFITDAPWTAALLWRRLRAVIPDREGVLILDGTSFSDRTHRRHFHRQVDGRRAGCVRAVRQRRALGPHTGRYEGRARTRTLSVSCAARTHERAARGGQEPGARPGTRAARAAGLRRVRHRTVHEAAVTAAGDGPGDCATDVASLSALRRAGCCSAISSTPASLTSPSTRCAAARDFEPLVSEDIVYRVQAVCRAESSSHYACDQCRPGCRAQCDESQARDRVRDGAGSASPDTEK